MCQQCCSLNNFQPHVHADSLHVLLKSWLIRLQIIIIVIVIIIIIIIITIIIVTISIVS